MNGKPAFSLASALLLQPVCSKKAGLISPDGRMKILDGVCEVEFLRRPVMAAVVRIAGHVRNFLLSLNIVAGEKHSEKQLRF